MKPRSEWKQPRRSAPPRSTKPLTRSGVGKRKTPVKARKLFIDRGAPIPKKNKASLRKKLARYQKFMRSPEWAAIRKACFGRAGHRCEFTKDFGRVGTHRCPMTTTLTAHHLRYTRFGGRELPSDLQCLCREHHDHVEAMKGGQRMYQRAAS